MALGKLFESFTKLDQDIRLAVRCKKRRVDPGTQIAV